VTVRAVPRVNRRWLIADRPLGRALRDSDFRLDEAPIVEPAAGQVRVRTEYLSLDPSQKGFMENVASYAAATNVGGVMPGTGVGCVVASTVDALPEGTRVRGELGWQQEPVVDAARLERLADGTEATAALGALGMTGRTAYFGLLHVGQVRPGDTVVITGAAGAVGSVVGQIARIAGARVVGIAGGAAKRNALVRDLGFDAGIDHRSEKVRARLRELCPKGIDVLFDNVGGAVLDDGLARLANGARVVICGAIARYNVDPRDAARLPPGPQNYFNVVFTRSTITGFLVQHFEAQYPEADRRLAAWHADGRIKSLVDVVEGFEQAPRALMRLFEGENVGKQLLRVDPRVAERAA
jgi:NADPH-dependent curcumin reductase CurA